MADDYSYEIDIYDDDNLDDQPVSKSNNTSNINNHQSGGDSDIEIETTFDDPPPKQQQTVHSGGKWQVLRPQPQPDSRSVDSNATTALSVSDLDWWTTEEEVRGWAAEAQVEYELKDVTFNEHKANGKSRGAVFLEFISPQAATAVKTFLESNTKYSSMFYNASNNPFRMIPKDPIPRGSRDMGTGQLMSGGMVRGGGTMRGRGGYGMQAGRGGYSGRGGGNMGGGMPNMQFNPGMQMGFNPMGMFGFPGRGGMPMNVGRGGMQGVGRGRGMEGFNPMMGGFGGFPPQGFPQPHFNPAFFNGQDQGQQGGWQGDGGNPHGNKRQRGPD
ncbi:hypothetical protein V1517DRAFT_339178 [Lipomyces orientalis]|uniref:Uncharacterized protein n=1 Tax=Lipomyces orientalis TaxID=1233043 RepID=A0ACC3TMF9_9ASCO